LLFVLVKKISYYVIIFIAPNAFGFDNRCVLPGKKKAFAVATGDGKPKSLHSRPSYYGTLTAIWCGIPALLLFGFWLAFESNIITNIVIADLPEEIRNLSKDRLTLVVNDIKNLVIGNIVSSEVNATMQAAADHYRALRGTSHAALAVVVVTVAIIGIIIVRVKMTPTMRARNHVERLIKYVFILCSTIAIFTTIGILLSVIYEAVRFFKVIPITEFLFGLKWSPQMAIRADQVGSSGAFGAMPVFLGTLLISVIAMSVAVPIGLMSAIYLSEYANRKFRATAKPLMEILAGIPTVVYGFFAALTVSPPDSQRWILFGLGCLFRKRLGSRSGNGHYDHSFCVLHFR
jgi:phosphate transport system permease protein